MHSYIDDLNALYSTRIFLKENVGLGPNAEDSENGAPMRKCLKCDQTAEDCECEWNKADTKSEDDMVFAKKEKSDDYDSEDDEFSHTGEHPEHKASNMAKQNLYRIAKNGGNAL